MSKHNPFRGKWTLKRILKRELEYNGGEMPVEDLLNKMSQRGFLKGPLREGLEALEIEVIDGMARLRY